NGRGSTGGTINMVTKTPQLDPFYRGDFGVGTDEYIRSTFDLNQPIDDFGLPVEGMAVRLNSLIHHNDIPGRKVVENERWGLSPSLAIGLGTPTRFTATYFLLRQDNIPDYGIPWVPTDH